jgi:hypothetical protein
MRRDLSEITHGIGQAATAGPGGSGDVALPVLMATTACVVGAQFDWRRRLSERVAGARCFYLVLAASIGRGLATSLARVWVIDMLVATNVIGAGDPVWPGAPDSPG